MKIKCPKCKENAELTPDFSLITCTKCNLEMSYGEYVRYIAHSDSTYSDDGNKESRSIYKNDNLWEFITYKNGNMKILMKNGKWR